jgi:hypothetical protein
MEKAILVLALVGALAFAGCATTSNTPTTTTTTPSATTATTPATTGGQVQELDFTATQSGPPANGTTYMYSGPDSAMAGWNLVKLTNDGMEPHQVVFMKLQPGETMEQHLQAMAAMMQPPPSASGSGGAMENNSTSSGGMGNPTPTPSMDNTSASGASNGTSGSSMPAHDPYGGGVHAAPLPPPGSGAPSYPNVEESYVWLEPGTYVIECEIPGFHGEPHLLHGMMKEINVTGPAPAMGTNEPQANFTVTLKDFSFTWDGTPTAGRQIVKVVNAGSMPHEAAFFHLAPSATIDDALNFTTNPMGAPPFGELSGAGAIEPGHYEYAVLNVASGDNVGEACFMPAPNGELHFMLGMKGQFHVA